jgi:hypothetical protein
MSIAIECPGCRAGLQVPDRLAGRKIRCTTCREEFRVGGDEPAEDYEDEPRPRRRRSKQRSTLVSLLIAGGILCACVIVAGTVVWFLPSKKEPPHDPMLGVRKRSYPAGTLPVHFLPPQFRSQEADPPAKASEIAVLSNLRPAGPDAYGDAVFDVDYSFSGARPIQADWPTLKVRTPKGTGEVSLALAQIQAQGTWRIALMDVDGKGPRVKIDVWLEKKPMSKRERITKVITVN